VITLVAIDDKEVAVHSGSFLSERAGLRKGTVNAMIEQSFIPLAREGKYPEAVASLLTMIEDHVAKQDTAVTAQAKNSLVAPAETGQSGAQVAVPSGKEEATQAGIQNQMILALVASLLAVGLIVAALIWLARHRTRNAVESKMICVVCNSENPNSPVSCSCCGSPLRPETALTPALPVGTRLQGGLYSIGKVLGQGGFGITYLGSDSGLKRAVAIKEFFPQVQGCSRDGATVQPGGMITHLEYRQEKTSFSQRVNGWPSSSTRASSRSSRSSRRTTPPTW